MKKIILLIIFAAFLIANEKDAQLYRPIVSAETYMDYKKMNGHLDNFVAPKIVLICYQNSTIDYLLNEHPDYQLCPSFSSLYLSADGQTGILGGWGMGAPGLSVKMEQLIALGVKQFIAIGTAGSLMDQHPVGAFILCPKALAEDGVAHLYLPKKETSASADEAMLNAWNAFADEKDLPRFHEAAAWSFSAFFRETPHDIKRVTRQGYGVVEMEAATLYAIGQDKGVQTLTLFVVSDTMNLKEWKPQLKDSIVKDHLHQLADWVLDFSATMN